LRKAIELTEDISLLAAKMPEHEREVLGSEMSRYAFLLVGRLSKAVDAPTAARRYRNYATAGGAVASLQSLLEVAVRVRVLSAQDAERATITADELAHMLRDLAGAPDWFGRS
jgi:hypothetical protein